ncbi:MAG: DUF484 family protein [Gammaproteobacteria bacterium]|nr:DUF484 family protein [Gammaproteobacteria bacterium]NIN62939.1 DUF484 family protein [Gammaproteobacteria bacterium]NIO63920.1 DUF484 family protein [Gammaproteobacteria bacterium]NIP50298.1 DUF484 family protein [Gammaproteobacteria bacterium]NIQ12518.1 DUF484 family protein [Gammaproteobacteria bacterium]
MTTQKENNAAISSISDDDVVDYLCKHPDFFHEHTDLLSQLEIPHIDSGGAISLVERQVQVLREQNQHARKKLHELIEIARQNEELARRMHKLSLTLMDADEPKDIFSTLYDNLMKNFHADKVAVRLFADPAFIDSYSGEEFAGSDAEEKALFKSIIDKLEPLCGRMKHQQRVFMFGDDGNEVASSIMLPLHGKGWSGILSIASFDPERFQPGMGVELLANLTEVLSFILKPWVIEN